MPPVSGEQRECVALEQHQQETQNHSKQQPLTKIKHQKCSNDEKG